MVADSCYSDMLCFTNYIEFLSHDVGGGLANCYIISKGGFVKVLYNVIWGRVVLKIGIFLLYNMWTAPKVCATDSGEGHTHSKILTLTVVVGY